MTRRLSFSNARLVLTGVWLLFFLADFVCVFYLYLDRWIEWEDFRASIQQLNSLYVTYLGVMLSFFFIKPGRQTSSQSRAGMPFVIAMASSLVWNVTIFILIFRLVFQSGKIEASLREIGFLGPILSWLVAPAIGFYFANSISARHSGNSNPT
jgi:hypothetical protein